MASGRSVHVLVGIARREIEHEWRQFAGEPEAYVAEIINTIERGDLHRVADDWARQQNEYVYTSHHSDTQHDYDGTDEWQEAERRAAKVVAKRLDQRLHPLAPDAGERLIKIRDMLRAETVAEFLAGVYTTATWDFLHLVRAGSERARIYLDEQAELALMNVRDVPHFD